MRSGALHRRRTKSKSTPASGLELMREAIIDLTSKTELSLSQSGTTTSPAQLTDVEFNTQALPPSEKYPTNIIAQAQQAKTTVEASPTLTKSTILTTLFFPQNAWNVKMVFQGANQVPALNQKVEILQATIGRRFKGSSTFFESFKRRKVTLSHEIDGQPMADFLTQQLRGAYAKNAKIHQFAKQYRHAIEPIVFDDDLIENSNKLKF